jgi:hypothetical protein
LLTGGESHLCALSSRLSLSLKCGDPGKMKSSVSSHLQHYVSEFKDAFTLIVKFAFIGNARNLLPLNSLLILHSIQVEASILPDRPGMRSITGGFSPSRSSSGPSKFAIFATDLCKASVFTCREFTAIFQHGLNSPS